MFLSKLWDGYLDLENLILSLWLFKYYLNYYNGVYMNMNM